MLNLYLAVVRWCFSQGQYADCVMTWTLMLTGTFAALMSRTLHSVSLGFGIVLILKIWPQDFKYVGRYNSGWNSLLQNISHNYRRIAPDTRESKVIRYFDGLQWNRNSSPCPSCDLWTNEDKINFFIWVLGVIHWCDLIHILHYAQFLHIFKSCLSGCNDS